MRLATALQLAVMGLEDALRTEAGSELKDAIKQAQRTLQALMDQEPIIAAADFLLFDKGKGAGSA